MLMARSKIIVGAINNHAMVRSENPAAARPSDDDDFNATSMAMDGFRSDMIHL